MADETKPAIGMSVGATTLAAVTAERAIARRPVLTLYPDRSPQVGVPAENPNISPDFGEPGLMIADFVNQIGDRTPVVAPDGSAHRGEQLLADALRALAYDATEGRPLPAAVAVTYPGHWSTEAVDALRAALSRVPEWSHHPVLLIADVAAALTALEANPGLPTDGIIAVCDFGGSGSSFTLVDAAQGYHPVGATVRYTGLSGDLIEQALLDHVVADLTAEGAVNGSLAIGSLARLRSQCRDAKEQLSTNTVTELAVDLPGFHGGVWLTRAELDEAIRQPFDGFLAVAQKTLEHNGVQKSDLVAVVAVGGGANLPAVTTGLARHLGGTVISSPRPQLTAAIGAALKVAAGAPNTGETAAGASATEPVPPEAAEAPPEKLPAAPVAAPIVPPTAPPAPPEIPPVTAPMTPAATPVMPPSAEPVPPQMVFQPGSFPDDADNRRPVWYRRPMPVILLTALAALVIGIVAIVALRHAAGEQPTTSTVTSVSATPSFEQSAPRTRPAPIAPPPESTDEQVGPEVPAMPPGLETPEAPAP